MDIDDVNLAPLWAPSAVFDFVTFLNSLNSDPLRAHLQTPRRLGPRPVGRRTSGRFRSEDS